VDESIVAKSPVSLSSFFLFFPSKNPPDDPTRVAVLRSAGIGDPNPFLSFLRYYGGQPSLLAAKRDL